MASYSLVNGRINPSTPPIDWSSPSSWWTCNLLNLIDYFCDISTPRQPVGLPGRIYKQSQKPNDTEYAQRCDCWNSQIPAKPLRAAHRGGSSPFIQMCRTLTRKLLLPVDSFSCETQSESYCWPIWSLLMLLLVKLNCCVDIFGDSVLGIQWHAAKQVHVQYNLNALLEHYWCRWWWQRHDKWIDATALWGGTAATSVILVSSALNLVDIDRGFWR